MCSLFTPKPTTNFSKKQISGVAFGNLIQAQGWKIPMGMMDNDYYYTDAEGWATVLADMTFNGSLYSAETMDCEDYALKAMVTATEKYGLNTFGFAVGSTPAGQHGFNFFYTGDRFLLHEPNAGYNYGYFEIGEHGYHVQMVLV